ncbi:MAG: hypothetical protein CFE30_01680 [Bradyrhizobium sp. PARBB1]|nr:MAG: hypothetical protein CFE30_01680 [Bradyrhizobium sp. PARBB1]
MIVDNAVVPENCSGADAGKSTYPGSGLNRDAGGHEGAHTDFNVRCHHSSRMNDGSPALIRNSKAFDPIDPRRHVFHLLNRRAEQHIGIE